MSQPTSARLPSLRRFAFLAWLVLLAQLLGVPLVMAAHEHYHEGQAGDHIHFGAIGHDAHHAVHHAARHRSHDAPVDCGDESRLPPHSVHDHLIDTDRPRNGDSRSRMVLAPLPLCEAPVTAPRPDVILLLTPRLALSDPSTPGRPEQSRAPPSLVV